MGDPASTKHAPLLRGFSPEVRGCDWDGHIFSGKTRACSCFTGKDVADDRQAGHRPGEEFRCLQGGVPPAPPWPGGIFEGSQEPDTATFLEQKWRHFRYRPVYRPVLAEMPKKVSKRPDSSGRKGVPTGHRLRHRGGFPLVYKGNPERHAADSCLKGGNRLWQAPRLPEPGFWRICHKTTRLRVVFGQIQPGNQAAHPRPPVYRCRGHEGPAVRTRRTEGVNPACPGRIYADLRKHVEKPGKTVPEESKAGSGGSHRDPGAPACLR